MSVILPPNEGDQSVASQIAESLAYYYDDPVSFVEDFFHATVDPWQAEAMRAIANGKSVSVVSGHGVGKSAVISWLIIWYLCTRPMAKIPCTAPTAHQLSDILWSEIQTWLADSPIKPLLNWTATRLSMIGMEGSWFAAARTSSTPEALAGFHAKHILFVVDEASGVDDQVFNVVEGAITSEGATLFMAGNGTKAEGYFFDSHNKNKKDFHTIHVSSEDSPRVSPNWVQGMREKWGVNSNVYRVRVQGLFPQESENTFIPENLVRRAVGTPFIPLDGKDRYEMGIDVARYGSDDTAFVIRRGGNVVYTHKQNGLSLTATCGKAIDLCRTYNVRAIKTDDTGVGGGLSEMLMNAQPLRDLHVEIYPIQFGGAGDEFHRDTSSRMWSHVRELLVKRVLSIPAEDENSQQIVTQLSTRHYQFNERGKIVLESKEKMRARKIPSPDVADALVLAFWDGDTVPYAESLPSLYSDTVWTGGVHERAQTVHTGEAVIRGWTGV